MIEKIAVHECIFCTQTFGSAVEKDDHVLVHFAQEICTGCDQNLIKIGGKLYIEHDAATCIRREIKPEQLPELCTVDEITFEYECKQTNDPGILEFSDMLNNSLTNATSSMATSSTMAVVPETTFIEEVRIKAEPMGSYENETTTMENDANLNENALEKMSREPNSTIDKIDNIEALDANVLVDNDLYVDGTLRNHDSEGGTSIECDICRQIMHKRSLTRHKKTVHNIVIEAIRTTQKKRPTCDVCGQTYGKKFLLRKHMNIRHSAPGTPVCKICGRILNSDGELRVHQDACITQRNNRPSINAGKPNECNVCKRLFKTNVTLKLHMRLHDPKNFACDTCGLSFMEEDSLTTHRCRPQRKYKQEDGRIKCHLCDQILHKGAIGRHRLRFHSTPDVLYCIICSRTFQTDDELATHRKECTLKQQNQECRRLGEYKCDLCAKVLKTKGCLNKHLRLKHLQTDTKFQCEVCGTVFGSKSLLQKHFKKTHLGVKDFVCEICKQTFCNKLSYIHHKYRHTGEKPFKCLHEGCGKSFRSTTNRAEHMRVHTNEKPYQCTFDGCVQRFRFTVDFRRHKYKAHGIITKKFSCEICSEIFPEKSFLNKHMVKQHS